MWQYNVTLLCYCGYRCNVFATFVTEGRVSGDLCLAVWTWFESETFGSDVLVHTLS